MIYAKAFYRHSPNWDRRLTSRLKIPYRSSTRTSNKSCQNPSRFLFTLSEIRFNRYHVYQKMDMHFDHIKSLFDGSNPGIPALSFVGALNDNYEGGELVFWKDYSIKLKKGEVLFFTSNFLYQHRVNPILNGVRDTFVCWAW